MAGPVGPGLLVTNLRARTVDTLLSLLRPGQSVNTTVQGQPGNTFLMLRGARVPLEAGTQLQPGQRVSVTLTQTNDGPRLQIQPQAPPPPPTNPPPTPQAVETILTRVVKSLDTPLTAANARPLLPQYLPLHEPAVRQLLTVLASRGNLGRDLQFVVTAMRRAVSAGAVPATAAHAMADLVRRVLTIDGSSSHEQLQQLAQQLKTPTEARLAHAIEQNFGVKKSIQQDIRALLTQISRDGKLIEYLRATGEDRAVLRVVEQITDRIAGSQIQNTRAFEFPYLFLELPCDGEGPISQGHVHFFGDRNGNGQHIDRQNATIVLDLNTTRLGDLWIQLESHGTECACQFRVTSEAVRDALRAESESLKSDLTALGYEQTHITFDLWDGDRLRELGERFGRVSGVSFLA